MAKKEVLDFKPAPRPEQVGDKTAAEGMRASRRMMRLFCLAARIRAGWDFRDRQVRLMPAQYVKAYAAEIART